MADLLSIGITGIKVHRTALSTTGHNIANANTPGYTRQEAVMQTGIAMFEGFGYVGSGAEVDTVRRIFDQFLTQQVRYDTQQYQNAKTYRDNIEQIDRLLSDENSGLSPALDDFFSAMQNAADNPAYIPAREVFLGEARSMASKLETIHNRFLKQNETISGQIDAITTEVNVIAAGIAQLNDEIANAKGAQDTEPPNDLMDKRDELVRQLSEYVEVDVLEVDDGSYNIAIGKGQALVLRNESFRIEATPGVYDSSRVDIRYKSNTENIIITDSITGGQLEGMLSFRSESLDPALNALGRIAVGITMEMNRVNKLGIDLEGRFGENIFRDINDSEFSNNRTSAWTFNGEPNDKYLSVTFSDPAALTTSDYRLVFTGPDDNRYEVIRLEDEAVVLEGAVALDFPETLEFDGLEVTLLQGTFQAGDRFQIQPLRMAATQVEVEMTRPATLALAYPIRADTSLGNSGEATINQGQMISRDTEIFQTPGQLSPPLMIRFESPERYTILDYSDPQHPKQLSPPMRNLPFTPGGVNQIFPTDPGQTLVTSYREVLPQVAYLQPADQPRVTPLNSIFSERFSFSQFNEETSKWERHWPTLETEPGASVAEIAETLNTVPGVTARAYTSVELSGFTTARSGPSGTPYDPDMPTDIWINGHLMTIRGLGESQNIFMDGYPEDVPDGMNPNFLADRINHHYDLAEAGIYAKSDGVTLTIYSPNGENIDIEIRGDAPTPYDKGSPPPLVTLTPPFKTNPTLIAGPASLTNGSIDPGDGFRVSTGEVYELDITGRDTKGLLTETQGYDFTVDGPYTWEFSMPGGPQNQRLVLDKNYVDGETLVADIEAKIEKLIDRPGGVDVTIDELGNISFKIYTTMHGMSNQDTQRLTIGGELDVVMDNNIKMTTSPVTGNIFDGEPEALKTFKGFQFEINGRPEIGDTYFIEWNDDGSADNRNALDLAALQSSKTLNADDGGMSFNEAYGKVVEVIGVTTRQKQIATDSTQAILQQDEATMQNQSGVNLDEEAARMMRFETAYNAAAQVIRVAQELFDSLLAAF